MSAVRTSPELIALGEDGKGVPRYTSREMLAVEQRLEQASLAMARNAGRPVGPGRKMDALEAARERGLELTGEQRDALDHVTGKGKLSVVIGYAGAGKSAMLGVAREAWEAEVIRLWKQPHPLPALCQVYNCFGCQGSRRREIRSP